MRTQEQTMNRVLLLLILATTLLISCGPSVDELTNKRVQGLSEIAELGTVEYTVKKIVKTDDAVWWKYGNRKIIYSCSAFIKAGINMHKFSPEQVKINQEEKSISVVLPKAEILSFNMPPEAIKEEFSMVTGLRDSFTPEEKQQLLVLGEKDIRQDIPNMGIIEDAEANAKMFFVAMFAQFGYEKIIVKFE